MGQSVFRAVFTLGHSNVTASAAHYSLQGVEFSAHLTGPNLTNTAVVAPDLAAAALTIINSQYPTCPSLGVKTATWRYNSTYDATNGTFSNQVPGAGLTYNVGPRMNGLYRFDSTCIPSKSCCCGINVVSIISNTTYSALGRIHVAGAFDGGVACYGYTAMSADFTVDSNTTAYYDAAGLRFFITWSNNYTNVIITDSFHENCNSQAIRVSSTSPIRNTASHSSSPLFFFPMLAAALFSLLL